MKKAHDVQSLKQEISQYEVFALAVALGLKFLVYPAMWSVVGFLRIQFLRNILVLNYKHGVFDQENILDVIEDAGAKWMKLFEKYL